MKKLILVLVLICWPLPSLALKVTSLYQVEISVASQTDDIKEQAITDGFSEVLLKVSGDPNILNNALIKSNLKRADYYVQDYAYSLPSTNSSLYTILIHYNEADIKRLLKKAGELYWGENRPLLLVWLSITDKNNNTQIIDSESDSDTYNKMALLGKKVGLPIMFPMMDMNDMNQVTSEDVLSMALPTLTKAAQRYFPDGLLVGNIKATDSGFDGDWQLVVGQNQWKWSMTDATLDSMTDAIINQVSQTLAKYYIIKDNAKTISLKMNVKNVNHGTELALLIEDLRNITSVKHVVLSQVSGDEVDLAITARGDMDSFQQNLAIDQKLVLKSTDSIQNKLFYEWAH